MICLKDWITTSLGFLNRDDAPENGQIEQGAGLKELLENQTLVRTAKTGNETPNDLKAILNQENKNIAPKTIANILRKQDVNNGGDPNRFGTALNLDELH